MYSLRVKMQSFENDADRTHGPHVTVELSDECEHECDCEFEWKCINKYEFKYKFECELEFEYG